MSNLKWNWGMGIVSAFVLFMGFILYFVIRVQTNADYNNELVAANYYQREAGVQSELEQQQAAAALVQPVRISSQREGLIIAFPSDWTPQDIQGTVSLYRPSSQRMDFSQSIHLTQSHLLIPKRQLAGGRWDIALQWTYQGKAYLQKESLYVE